MFPIIIQSWGIFTFQYLLAVVEDDSAVGPAVVVDQREVGEESHPHSLQASLIAQCEGITLDLHKHKMEGT